MSYSVFLDTNILLDFIFERQPFFDEAVELFQLRADNKLEFYVSSLSLANLAYNIQRQKRNPRPIIEVFLNWTQVVALDKNIFLETVPSAFKDFEDGLQFFSALRVENVDAIISRNKKDFFPSSIPVLTAGEYIERFKENS
jgi:predicted nucleic acid-binding protein